MRIGKIWRELERIGAVSIAAGGALLLAAGLMLSHRQRMLTQLHPIAREVFRDFIDEVEARTGWRVVITSGYRSHAQQQRLVDAGNPYAVAPGSSPHNYGMAIDINLVKDGQRIGMRSSNAAWVATGVVDIAKRYGLRWGGEFRNRDRVHFDVGWSPSAARAFGLRAQAQFPNG